MLGRCFHRPRLTFETGSSGIDEALQTLTSDPYGAPVASGAGLRIPAFQPAAWPNPPGRFLFLLASRQVQQRTRIRGLSQLLTIGTNTPVIEGGPPSRPLEVNVTTPTFRFPDGNVSWHLVIEPNVRTVITRPLTDAANFMFMESDQPALIYSMAAFSAGNTNPVTGAPLAYPVGMTRYTAPLISQQWEPIGGLGCFYDLRFTWDSSSTWNNSIDIPIVSAGNIRVSFYASVLQTGGNAYGKTAYPNTIQFLPPEEGFISDAWANGVYYWRIGGRIVFEDDLESGCVTCGATDDGDGR